jgi:hypothetical protein
MWYNDSVEKYEKAKQTLRERVALLFSLDKDGLSLHLLYNKSKEQSR